MTSIYACLAGNWVRLNDDKECVISSNRQSPYIWWEEGADVYSPLTREKANTLYEFDYVEIFYMGKDYRINPIFLQIVNE